LAPKKEQDNYWKKKEKHPSHKKLIVAKEACYEGLPEAGCCIKQMQLCLFLNKKVNSLIFKKTLV